ncbi:calpain-8-like [Bombina bombina]|uniref:calpain-8-like n=1 Tax=Bombina bombina TaxID=8345 RepID=UPI00235A7117|nr:calpain-8-like [Bombina bombina]
MSGVAARVAKERAAECEGLGTCQNPVKYLGQDFEELRTQCLASGTLFKDEDFPACSSIIGYRELGPNSAKTKGVVWKRPSDICPSPQFIVSGATRSDICQGEVGDCWLMAAIASLTLYEDVLAQVVPQNQSFQDQYAGIFHFKFWQYGEWVDVVVDDRLPTVNGSLMFVHSAEGNEFWSALLEKAYAKLNGSYEALSGGFTVEGFEDFTGGISEFYDLKSPPANLFQIIQKALKKESLLGCSINISNKYEIEKITQRKLVKGHAYSVTGAEEVLYHGCKEKLIRLRNPWGDVEWTGPWCDGAPEWNDVDPKVKEELEKQLNDGEFWMPFSDFLKEYSRIEVCHLSVDSLTSTKEHKWEATIFHGSWTRGSTAGGCHFFPATYWTNPQFRIKLNEADDDHDCSTHDPCCTVIIGLMQKNRRKRKRIGEDLHKAGFTLYRLDNQTEGLLNRKFFTTNEPVAQSDCVDSREVSIRLKLPVGDYVIVPSTYEPFKSGDFCLRVFSEKETKPLDDDAVKADSYEPRISDQDGFVDCRDIFEKLNAQRKEMNAYELQIALNKLLENRKGLKSDGFSLVTCREMINLMDMDETGTLSLEEFKALWMKLQKYTEIYLKVDANHSGTMEAHEMRQALQEAGFTLNEKIQQRIVQRFASSDVTINFDGFISCVIRLETLFKMFQLLDVKKSGEITLTLPEWLHSTLL